MSYIPTKDAQALQWMQAFVSGITASPSTYMLAPSDAVAISDAVNEFAQTLPIASDPKTRTPVTVSDKDTARNAAEQICRQYVMVIKNNGGISDSAKIAIGVRPINPSREPIPCPQSAPLLNVLAATPGAHTVRYVDTNTPNSSAKPFGASELQLFVAIMDEPTIHDTDAQFYGKFTRSPIGVAFADKDDGKMATYFGRWASRRGDVGPYSFPVSMRISA